MSETDTVNVRALLNAISLSTHNAESYPAGTRVLDVKEIVKIVKELQEDMSRAPE